MSDLFWFSDEQWARIEPLLPNKPRGVPRVDDCRVLSGIVHALKSSGRWSDSLPAYGPKKTLYNRFVRWADNGTWERIFHALAAHEDLPGRLFIDATLIKAHRTAGGAKRGLWPMVSAVPSTDVSARSTPCVTSGECPGRSSQPPGISRMLRYRCNASVLLRRPLDWSRTRAKTPTSCANG